MEAEKPGVGLNIHIQRAISVSVRIATIRAGASKLTIVCL